MTLELLQAGSPDGPLIRLFEYGPGELAGLRDGCAALAVRGLAEFHLHEQSWVRAVGGVRLTLRAADRDRSTNRRAGTDRWFVMEYAPEGWHEVVGKVDALRRGPDGFQWLASDGVVPVLLSHDGRW